MSSAVVAYSKAKDLKKDQSTIDENWSVIVGRSRTAANSFLS